MTVYVKVPVSERLPDKEWLYITDKGILDFKKSYGGIFIRNVRIVSDVTFWLEEQKLNQSDIVSSILVNAIRELNKDQAKHLAKELIERFSLLPTDDEIMAEILLKQQIDQTPFMRGIDYILNKLKCSG